MIKHTSVDERALNTPVGRERRAATNIGLQYIRGKVDLETPHVAHLGHQSARMDRGTAQVVCFAEGSLTGMVYEAIGRGFDPAAAFDDAVFSSPGTDVLDVGSDLKRWHEPTAKINAQLYVWHMGSDRHMFLRRAVLGYSRVRLEAEATVTAPLQQREGDFDEVFGEGFRTTGFSWLL